LDHPKTALSVLKQLTGLFSAEFAIRPFLIAHPEYCQKQLAKWTQDKDEHIRRLASEGSRPRLPWGMQLKPYIEDPSPNLPLLEALKNDSSLYVRRSVANHLNDIAKDHPDLVIAICKRWYPDASPDLRWVIKHATRSLVKSGHPEVFPLLGYSDTIELTAPRLQLSSDLVQMGESLEFQLDLKSSGAGQQKMVVDFAIHFVKANGERKPKVFKLKSVSLAPGESSRLVKAHPIKAISTRKYYPGTQLLEILVNGKSMVSREFTLITD
jgi:3-methyladenine DNA glycosylase AlkC